MAAGGGTRFTDRRCRGRRPRRPAEVSGGAKVHGRDESLPYGLPVSGSWPEGGGGVKTPPYDAKDKGAVTARLREWIADERGEGGRQPAPFKLAGG